MKYLKKTLILNPKLRTRHIFKYLRRRKKDNRAQCDLKFFKSDEDGNQKVFSCKYRAVEKWTMNQHKVNVHSGVMYTCPMGPKSSSYQTFNSERAQNRN
jgi:hypothetical protein